MVNVVSKLLYGLIYILTPSVYIGAVLIHLWTSYIAYANNSFLSALLAFFLPVISQLYWGFKFLSATGFDSLYVKSILLLIALWIFQYVIIILASISSAREEQKAAREAAVSTQVIDVTPQDGKYYYGFGGWMYLLAIGLIYSSINSAIYLFNTLPIYQDGTLALLAEQSSGWVIAILFETLYSLFFFIFPIYIGFLCLKLKKSFIKATIFLYASNVVLIIVHLLFALLVPDEATRSAVISEFPPKLIGAVIAAAIWIPYLINSKRIRNTYII